MGRLFIFICVMAILLSVGALLAVLHREKRAQEKRNKDPRRN